jgi:hypothetical protein
MLTLCYHLLCYHLHLHVHREPSSSSSSSSSGDATTAVAVAVGSRVGVVTTALPADRSGTVRGLAYIRTQPGEPGVQVTSTT